MFQSPVSVYWKLLCIFFFFFLGTSILLLSFCLAVDPDVGIRQHEEDEITVVGGGGDMSGGMVGGGRGVAGRRGGQLLKHSGVYISGNGHCLIVTWRHKHFNGSTQYS